MGFGIWAQQPMIYLDLLYSKVNFDFSVLGAGMFSAQLLPEEFSNSKKHVCPMCGKNFARRWDLENHVRIHTGAKPYKCEICDRRFNVKSNLRAHMVIHVNTAKIFT